MYSRARKIQEDSFADFSPRISSTVVKLRIPESQAASPVAFSHLRTHDIRLLNYLNVANVTFPPQIRNLAYLANRCEWPMLVQSCAAILARPTYPQIFPIYAYFGALLAHDAHREPEFRGVMASATFPPQDVPHISHLMDEISCLADLDDRRLLVKCLVGLGDIKPHKYTFKPVDVPLISSRITDLLSPLSSQAKATRRWGTGTDINPANKMKTLQRQPLPRLEPVGEGFDQDFEDDKTDPMTMVVEEKYREAAAAVSQVLKKERTNSNMLRLRIVALTRMNKITDAILDCSALLDIASCAEVRKLRSALWKSLGFARYAEEDRKPPGN
jgi:hypothetical protein